MEALRLLGEKAVPTPHGRSTILSPARGPEWARKRPVGSEGFPLGLPLLYALSDQNSAIHVLRLHVLPVLLCLRGQMTIFATIGKKAE